MSTQADYEGVLEFWFGALDARGVASEARSRAWFEKNDAFDREIEQRFGALHAALARGERDDWLSSTRGALAAVIVLDQFSRNMFRNTKRMFESDPRALAIAAALVERGQDHKLAFDERGFLYMPFMHSEKLADQERCVTLFQSFRDEHVGDLRERCQYSLGYAERHLEIIRRFGRFPHRNAILGRESTPEEIEFLKQPGSSF
jgi:uncharacterized protein (DUF924 family)